MSNEITKNKDGFVRKNCWNCQWLEYGFGDVGDPEGWVCEKKDLYNEEESKMLSKMESDDYKNRAKVCFEAKEKSCQ